MQLCVLLLAHHSHFHPHMRREPHLSRPPIRGIVLQGEIHAGTPWGLALVYVWGLLEPWGLTLASLPARELLSSPSLLSPSLPLSLSLSLSVPLNMPLFHRARKNAEMCHLGKLTFLSTNILELIKFPIF